MKSLNNLKQSLSVLKAGQSYNIKGGTGSTPPPPPPPPDDEIVGGPWDNRGKRPGTKG